jgi:hypothetical protein
VNEFQLAMVALDAMLTGKSEEQVAQQIHHKPDSVEKWWKRGEWYLSDGGYSRLWLNEEKIFVTDNSLERVKESWDLDAPEVVRVRNLVREFFKTQDWDWQG